MNDVELLAKIRCPVVAFGIGYNCVLERPRNEMANELPRDTVAKLKALTAVCDLIASRDKKLGQLLAEYAEAPIPLIGDPALFLDPAALKSRPVARERVGRVNVGVNLALHGPITASIFRAHFEVYVDFLKEVQRSQPVTFWYFVHCETERLAVDLLQGRGVSVEVVDLPPREMVAAYAQMDFVICQMLHSSILATNAGVPSINIGYDVKNVSFYELMGLSELCIPHDAVSVERLWNLWGNAINRRADIVEQLGARKAKLLVDTNLAVDRMIDLLGQQDRRDLHP